MTTPFGHHGRVHWEGRSWAGESWHGEIARAGTGPDVDLSTLPVPEALASLCAALGRGGTVVSGRPPGAPLPPVPPTAFLVAYTSGSTGSPRAVTRTAASWVKSFPDFTAATGITADDVVLLTGPLSSTLQLFAAAHALWLGATVTDDPQRATVTHLVPTRLFEVVAAPPPRLRTVVVAGAVLPERFRDGGLPFDLVEYYGAAELSLVAWRRPPAPLQPFPGVELRVRDGSLEVRSPFLALGPTDDGWRGVGDRATWDGHGLRVAGRDEDVLSVGGHTVDCAQVQDRLRGLVGVRDVVVLGLPHERFGQVPVAAVVTDRPLAELRAAARAVLRGPALPRRWVLPEALPRLPGGKVDRTAVLALFSDPPPR